MHLFDRAAKGPISGFPFVSAWGRLLARMVAGARLGLGSVPINEWAHHQGSRRPSIRQTSTYRRTGKNVKARTWLFDKEMRVSLDPVLVLVGLNY